MKLAFTFLIILSIYFPNIYVNSQNNSELYSITEEMEKKGYSITEWSAYQKEPVGKVSNEKSFYDFVARTKQKYSNYKWEAVKDINHHFKVIGLYNDSENHTSQRIIITAVKLNDGFRLELAREIKGKQWNIIMVRDLLKKSLPSSQQGYTFYSVKGSEKITNLQQVELTKRAKGLVSAFSAKEVESLEEANFVSFSALSSKWNYSLNLNNQNKMNLQIAMRVNSKNDTLNVTVGTPIITTEY